MFALSFRKAAKFASPAALLGLAACATPFQANVQRFQQLPPAQGQSFAVVSQDPADAGGIEFGQYANLVASEMVRQGYRQAASPASADLVVSFGYNVDNGREKVVSDVSPFYSPFGYGRLGYGGLGYGRFGYADPFYGPGYFGRRGRFGHGLYGNGFVYGFNDPFIFGGPGYGGGVRSYTIYTGEIDMKIERVGSGERLFEGRAQSLSRSNDLTYLVPNLVEAIFTGFPGNSGETVRISVAPETRR